MNPERWRKVDAIFQAALDRAPEERAAFLVEVCGKDDALRREVEALLVADQKADSLIEIPAYAMAAPLLVERDTSSFIGKSLSHYKILSLLGKGGMGEVYLAEDTRLHREVAVKILRANFAMDAERLRRFKQEARAVSALNHPNILTIHEIGEVEDTYYLVTEYIAGETLRQRLARAIDQKMEPAEVADVATQIANALAAAHQAGITHRDLKPENVMLRPDGLIKVLDFGMAKLNQLPDQGGISQSTLRGVVVGTVRYMSPEQARGQDVDHRTDIFSLGVMLYEMLEGRRPFEGATTSDVIAALLTAEPPGLTRVSFQASRGFSRIVTKCLMKNYHERYETASAVISDLKLQQRAHSVASLSRPSANWAGILGICVLVLLSVVLGWQRITEFKQATKENRRANPALQLNRFTASGNVITAAISPDGKSVAMVIDEDGLQSLWLKQVASNVSGVPLIAPAMVEYWGLTFSHDGDRIYYLSWGRNQSDAQLYQVPLLGGTPHRLPIKWLDTPIALAPAEDRFAYATLSPRNHESYVKVASIDAQVGDTFAKREEPGFIAVYPGGPAWSPDGNFIAYAATGQITASARPMHIFVTDAANRVERQLGSQSWAEMGRVAWLGDGSGLVVAAREQAEWPRQLWFVSWPKGDAYKITNDLHDYDSVSVSADGRVLWAMQKQEKFSIYVSLHGKGVSQSQAREIYSEVGRGDERLAWTPDHQLLYSSRVSGNWDIWMMNLDGGNQRQLTVDPHNDTLPSVSADGRQVYFVSDRTGSANIWRMNIDGSNAAAMTKGIDLYFPEITPDDQRLYYQQGGPDSNEISVWSLSPKGGTQARVSEQTSLERMAMRPAVSPSGKWIAYVSLDLQLWGVMLRALDGNQPPKKIPFPANIGKRDLRWLPNEKALAYIVNEKGVDNLWAQPINGGQPRPLTYFKTGRFSTFAWSPDGKWLASLQPTAISDVVLLRNFK